MGYIRKHTVDKGVTRLQAEDKETTAILLENQGRAECYNIAESDTWVWAGSQEERKTLCDETSKCVKEAFLLDSDWDVCLDIPFENCLKLAGDDKGEEALCNRRRDCLNEAGKDHDKRVACTNMWY